MKAVNMGGHDYTFKERQQRRRDRLKASGLAEVRERVPPDLVPVLKAIAAEMRDPGKAEEYRKRFPQPDNPSETRHDADDRTD